MVEKSVRERERRRFHRVRMPMEVRAKQSDLAVIYAKGFDLSAGGIGILSPDELPEGKTVELEMNIPPVIAHGQVVSKKEVEIRGGKFFQTGIRFTEMKWADRATLRAFLHNIMQADMSKKQVASYR